LELDDMKKLTRKIEECMILPEEEHENVVSRDA
jgi:hypothetical protein